MNNFRKVFKIDVTFFEGVAVAQHAKEGVIWSKYFVVEYPFVLELFIGGNTLLSR